MICANQGATKRAMILTTAAWLAIANCGWAMDQIFTSSSKNTLFGKITGMSATSVSFEPSHGVAIEIPANEIIRITYEGSPDALQSAQKEILSGNYAEALATLKKDVSEASRRPEIVDEIAFCQAFCTTQLAISGAEDPMVAGKLMVGFLKGSPNNYHNLQACELIGDLLVNAGKFAAAQEYYAKLALAPWPDYKIRAQVASGKAFLAEGKAGDAAKAFDEALHIEATGPLADMQRTAAQIGQDRCLILNGNTEKAIKDLEQILDRNGGSADVGRNPEVAALAHNALGAALRKQGKPKEAILQFLRVHLQYSNQIEAHAEAVANLAKLFTDTQKPDHAREMRKILEQEYQNTRWAKGV